jgi:ParB family transcriptional regulator, chromosome partitioning protein
MNMPLPKSRLGRGLASLIGEPAMANPRLPNEGTQKVIPIDQLHPSPLNPRKAFDEAELQELSNSIRTTGLIQPLIARPDPTGGYEIVAGERRWRASQLAGLHEVAVVVRDLDDRTMMEMAIIENVQRADLNPIEEAAGYNELIQRFQYTQDQLAEQIGKSRSHLANTMRLLRLPDDVQGLVLEGKISAGHARALVGREDAMHLALRAIASGMSVRAVEQMVQQLEKQGPKEDRPRLRDKDADTKAFEKDFSDALGLDVKIKRGSGESGMLVIRYGNFDQLDYVRKRVMGEG